MPKLFESLDSSGLLPVLREVILVDDASTDQTPAMLKAFAEKNKTMVRVVTLKKNSGRFYARWEGAKAAASEKILFLDTRLELVPGFTQALMELTPKHDALMGVVHVDTSTSVFSLYWDRTHKVIFRRHYKACETGFFLTVENYDKFLKGTTVFLCLRKAFTAACEKFSYGELLSDDTALLKVIVKQNPIWVDPRLGIRWTPRENAQEFLTRLWERGPSFVEYHVFARRSGPLFLVVLAGLIGLLFLGISTAFFPLEAIIFCGIFVLMVLASTAAFSKSPTEFFRMMPLHVAVISVFGMGILKGVVWNAIRLILGRLPKIP